MAFEFRVKDWRSFFPIIDVIRGYERADFHHDLVAGLVVVVAIIGGAKISGKIDVITNLLPKVDKVIIGGGMAYTFLKSQGYEIGDSLLDEKGLEVAEKALAKAGGESWEIRDPSSR